MKKISCPEWEPIKMGEFDEQYLYRHFMFLGETGSGKTMSGIMPLCRTAFSPDGPFREFRSAGMVVDPKGELAGYLEELLGPEADDRLIRLRSGGAGPVLWHFENSSPLENLGASGIVEKMMAFADSYQKQNKKNNDAYWINSSRQILTTLVELDFTLWNNGNGRKARNIEDFWNTFGAVQYLHLNPPASEEETPEVYGEPADEKSEEALSPVFRETRKSLKSRLWLAIREKCFTEELALEVREYAKSCRRPLINYHRGNYIQHLARVVELAQAGIHDDYKEYWSHLVDFINSWQLCGENVFDLMHSTLFSTLSSQADGTYSSNISVYLSIVNDIRSEEFSCRVSLNPFEPPEKILSTREVIEQGKVVVYEPGITNLVTRIIGKVLKSGFFKELAIPERLNNSSARPFFYICDEFHNFITQDPESGEQSFLDRCRAYRVCCGLATQSIASLLNELEGRSGEHSVSILLVNTATKFFFRNTDRFTAETLFGLIESPARDGKPHVIAVRPPSTLLPGECYYILVNGKSGRGRVATAVKAESEMTATIRQVPVKKMDLGIEKPRKQALVHQMDLSAPVG